MRHYLGLFRWFSSIMHDDKNYKEHGIKSLRQNKWQGYGRGTSSWDTKHIKGKKKAKARKKNKAAKKARRKNR